MSNSANTDNEQGYTPTTEEVKSSYVEQNHAAGDGTLPGLQAAMDESRAEFARWLATHRVTLEADNREALAKGLYLTHRGDETPWEHVGLEIVEAVLEHADALLASGVVQVTTPTETDELRHASERIKAERERQIAKGYTPEHDAEHGREHLIGWAKQYAVTGQPVKAAALLLALIDLDLASRPAPVAPPTEEWATTVEELDALPQDTIIGTTVAWKAREKAGAFEGGRFWTGAVNGHVALKESNQMTLPIRVLYRPRERFTS